MVQIHPTAIPGEDKCRLISESVRGELQKLIADKDGELQSHKSSLAKLQDAHEGLSRVKQVLSKRFSKVV